MLQTVQKQRFLMPSGLFRQDSDRMGHGQNFFRALEGVPKYTKKAKCVWGGLVKSHVHRGRGYPMYIGGYPMYTFGRNREPSRSTLR